MAVYSVCATNVNSLRIKPVLYEIRLTQITWWSWSVSNYEGEVRIYPSSTMSGTTAPVVPLRHGAPPASSVAYISGSPTGSWQNLYSLMINKGTTYQSTPYGNIYEYGTSQSQGSSPLPITVQPGGILEIPVMSDNGIWCTTYFEELRLAGSY